MDFSELATTLSNQDWTFESADTQYSTHGLHSYPARMIPQIPNALFEAFEDAGWLSGTGTVLDPFCGSGTTLVEAKRYGYDSVGFDINPFACELTRAKTTTLAEKPVDAIAELQSTYGQFIDIDADSELFVAEAETDVNDGWFPQPHFSQLVNLAQVIETLGDEYGSEVERLLRIALSGIVREVSYQRNGEFKRYRMPEEKRDQHTPDVFALLDESIEEVFESVVEFSQNGGGGVTVYQSDSRELAELSDDSIDCVITSPPYGDHRTTVAYGQFSRDLSIIAHNETRQSMLDVDKTGLGGRYEYETTDTIRTHSPSLERTILALEEVDGRSDDAIDFFEDYFAVMKQVGRVVQAGHPVVWVVSNRTMSRQLIPTHLITEELCEHIGYEHIATVPRDIPTKTLPWENAPENVEGETGELMADENIIVLAAPESVSQ